MTLDWKFQPQSIQNKTGTRPGKDYSPQVLPVLQDAAEEEKESVELFPATRVAIVESCFFT
jgi:hypothetical protein